MMPKKLIAHRTPSLLARHCEALPGSDCHGILQLHVTRSPIRGFEYLVVLRCGACFMTGHPTVEVRGVLFEDGRNPAAASWRDEDDDDDEPQPWGV